MDKSTAVDIVRADVQNILNSLLIVTAVNFIYNAAVCMLKQMFINILSLVYFYVVLFS